MGFTEANSTVEEEWVVGPRWLFGYSLACGMGKTIARADYEVLKGVPRIQG
jgi:hypothetical protein